MSVALSAEQALAVAVQAVALVCEVDPGSLRSDTSLIDDLQADSVSVVEIVDVTEELLRSHGVLIVFDDAKLVELVTVGAIAGYILAHRAPPRRARAAA